MSFSFQFFKTQQSSKNLHSQIIRRGVFALLGVVMAIFPLYAASTFPKSNVTTTVINYLTGKPVTNLQIYAQIKRPTNIVELEPYYSIGAKTDRSGTITFKNGLAGYEYDLQPSIMGDIFLSWGRPFQLISGTSATTGGYEITYHWYQSIGFPSTEGITERYPTIYALIPPTKIGVHAFIRAKSGYRALQPREVVQVPDENRPYASKHVVDVQKIPVVSQLDTIVINLPGDVTAWHVEPLTQNQTGAWYFPNRDAPSLQLQLGRSSPAFYHPYGIGAIATHMLKSYSGEARGKYAVYRFESDPWVYVFEVQ